MVFGQNWQILSYEHWWYHLKELLLNFQKIRKSFQLDHQNSSRADSSIVEWCREALIIKCLFHCFQDYVHSLAPHPSTTDLLLSSSYDHTLFLWDLRTPSTPVLELDHGAPVEGVLLFPSGGTCVSAGDNYIKVWDILSGGRLLALFSNHQKTITSICFDGTGQRLLSGGLDKLVACTCNGYTCMLYTAGSWRCTVWKTIAWCRASVTLPLFSV